MRIDVVSAATPIAANTAIAPATQNASANSEASTAIAASTSVQQARNVAIEAQKQQELREEHDATPSLEEIEKLISRGNTLFDELRLNEHFQLRRHDKLPTTMIRLVDVQRDRVIREFPPKNYLDLVAALQELSGLMFDKRV